MRWNFAALGLLVALAGLLALVPGESRATPPGFVTASGTQLMLDGQPYRFSGFNIYFANSDGWCGPGFGAGSGLDEGLTAMGPGKSVIRGWFFQPLGTDGGVRNWSRFDHTLSVAAAHGFRVIVTLTDQWGECGVLEDGGTNYYKTADWYTSGYMTPDAGMTASYRDWAAEVVTRYKDDPTVLMWQLINEAEVKATSGSGCLPGTQSRDTLIAWATDVSGLIKSIDPEHLVSLGTIGGGQCSTQYTEYQDVHAIPTIDVCEYHDYGSPTVPIPGDFWNGLQRRVDQCNALNKPLFIGELGIIPTTTGGTLEGRAGAIQAKRDAQLAAGIDGILAWSWSNAGSTLDNWDIGPGDPALEALILDDNCPADANPQQENADGDRWGDACDNCPAVSTPWTVPLDDADCDSVTDAAEAFIGTDPDARCGPGAWPFDFNDDQVADLSDVLQYNLPGLFASVGPNPPYDARYDLSGDGGIDLSDVLLYNTPGVFGAACE